MTAQKVTKDVFPKEGFGKTSNVGHFQRDEQIKKAAVAVIRSRGLSGLTREAIARQAQISPASVSNFGLRSDGVTPSSGFRSRVLSALMADAITNGDIALLRVGLADGCLKTDDVPAVLRGGLGL